MSNKKSLVEEAIIQMKNLEETVAQNAKGILASTMKKEIKDLVKESIVSEEDDEEIDTNVKMDMDTDSDEDDVEMDMDVDSDEDDTDMDMDADSDEDDVEMDMDVDSDEDDMDMDEPIDLTKHSDEEVMKVFKLMGPNDQIIVTKDNSGNINLKDGGNDTEYMLVGENEEENWNQEMSEDDDDDSDEMDMSYINNQDMETTNDSSIEDIINDVFGSSEEMGEQDDEDSEVVYEVEMDEQDEEDEDSEVVYEIEMDEQDEEGEEDEDDDDDDFMSESKMSIKPKGVGMGSPKFKYSSKPNQGQGFKTKMKQGNLKMGTGKPKFEFKEGENLDMEMTEVKPKFKKFETKEASRTYGNGSKSGRGLRKGITPNRNLTFESKTNNEIQILREKNEEYRKALNVFRNKLTEVAVFNSNLAYATRLFTEHTTSKHEKINILRRFDGVESIKESKNLYKSIKDELLNTTNQTMNESIERKIENTPVTGSVNLIESKTYENPQFARMKDLMSKIK